MTTYQHKVHYYETDKMGIVHHSNYVRWMEEARIDFFTQIGWDYKKLEDTGVISPVTAIECKYKATTAFADLIDIFVWVEAVSGVRLRLGYQMKRGDTLVCEGASEHCFLDANGKIVNLKKQQTGFYETLLELVGK